MVDESLFDFENGLNVKIETKVKKGRKKSDEKVCSAKEIDECALRYINNPTDRNFHELWKRSYWGLRQHAFKIVPNNYDVDDIIINVYEIILKKKDQYNPEKGKFSTWMYKICLNECFAYWNRVNRDCFVENDFEEIYSNAIMGDEFIDPYDYSDKFDEDIVMLDREELKKKFFDTSIFEIKKFRDKRIVNCMKERFHFYDERTNKRVKPLTLEQIAQKYNYPITSVKNWIIKGKIQLREAILTKHSDLYEMWKEVLD